MEFINGMMMVFGILFRAYWWVVILIGVVTWVGCKLDAKYNWFDKIGL